MAHVDWLIVGNSFGNCNCDCGCPCQFESLPTHGACRDERANQAQRAALDTILHGGGTDEAAPHCWVYSTMSASYHPTLYNPIRFDLDARQAKASIPGVLETEGRPIRGPATGHDHRVRIDIPGDIEFDFAEIGSGSATDDGAIALTLKDSYGQFNCLRHNCGGVIR